MKVVILAGGLGSRLAEETEVRPKPMVEIGGRPILWHIMKHYAQYGFREFLVAIGYKGEAIKRYFLEYHTLSGNLTVNLATGSVQTHEQGCDDWTVDLVETGLHTQTGGRLKRLRPWIGNEPVMLTYGDGVADLDLRSLLRFHKSHGRLATVTAVRPPARFGGISFDGDLVVEFTEKPRIGEGWINGGFMVLEPGVFEYLEGDDTVLESDMLTKLSGDRQLVAFRHDGFWQCMDTLRDKHVLESYWETGVAPWKVWQ